MKYQNQLLQESSQRKNFEPDQLVDSNIWLEMLEDRLQMFSKFSLSLYDFQNHETVFNCLLLEYDPKVLHVPQK